VYALAAASECLAQLERTLETSGPALAEAEAALADAERQLAAARHSEAGLGKALADATRLLKGLREKAETLPKQRAAAEAQLAALQEKQAALQDRSAETPADAEALAASRQEVADEVNEAVGRRDDLAVQQTELTARIADAQTGLKQLEKKKADNQARRADLDKRCDACRQKVDEARGRHLKACLARAGIERAQTQYDRAASTYRTALGAAGQSAFQEEARKGLFEVYLTQADTSEGDAARALLAKAKEIAEMPAETLRIGQAIAGTYERQGDPERALATYLDIARETADALVAVESGYATWHVSPEVAAAEGVRALVRKYGDRLAPALQQHAAAALEEARRKKTVHALRTPLRTFLGTDEAVRAGLEASSLAEADGRFEVAELILHEMRRSGHRPAEAAGLAQLARMHQDAGWKVQARAEWQHLADAYPDTRVVFGGEAHEAPALARRRLEAMGVPSPAPSAAVPPPPWQPLWKAESQHLSLLVMPLEELRDFARPSGSQFLMEHGLIWALGPKRGLLCHRFRDGKAVYDCDLSSQTLSFNGSKSREGHVVMARGGQDVSAVGLVSGKVLWTRKDAVPSNRLRMTQFHHVMNLIHRGSSPGRWGTGQSSTGAFVFAPDPQSVRAMDLATGRPLWERSFRRRNLTAIQEAGPFVCLVMDGGKDLWLCDASTGAQRGTISLNLGQSHLWSLVATREGILTQPRDPKTGMFRLVFRDLPSGQERWSTEPAAMTRMFYLLDEGTLCLVDQGRNLEIRDLATGALRGRYEAQPPLLPHMADVCLGPDGHFLYVVSRQGTQSGLTIVDLNGGGETRTYEFGENQAGRTLPAELYAAAGEYLPWVERLEGSSRYRVRFLRRSDGQPAEDVVLPASSGDGTFEHLTTVVCRDGVLLVVTNRSIEAFGHDPSDGKLVAE